MDFIFRAAEKFLNDHKRLMRYRKVFAVLAAVVVFATTYELILPAITIDRQRAAETPGMEVGVAAEEVVEESETEGSGADEEDAEAAEEESRTEAEQTQENEDTDSSDAAEESAAPETVENTDDGDADQANADNGTGAAVDETTEGNADSKETTKSSANAEADTSAAATEEAAATATTEAPAVEYPVTLTYEGEDYTVTATFDETAALPAGVSLDALEILPDTTYKNDDDITVYADYGEYYSRTLETLEKANCLEDQTISSARFFDIKFVDSEGFIVEPAAAVSIAVQYGDPLSTRDTLGTVAVHFDDVKIEDRDREDVPEIGKARVIETSNEFGRDDIETVSFEAETFSVYAIVGTAPGTPVNMTAGTTETITPDYPSGVTGAKYQSYIWTSSDASVISIQSGNNDSSAVIKAEKAGTATVTLNYKYGKKEKGATSGKAVFEVTVTEAEDPEPGSGGDPDPAFTDQDATAQEGILTDVASGGMTVTVKETGRLKKLSDYHVVVEDAADEYSDDADMLRAYHIYLADESGKEVTDLEKDLKNSQNLSLRVTITYDEEQDWFDQAKDIKHYKNGEEQTINGVTFGKDKKTISFNVRGFSDFVFVKNPGSAQPGEGGVTTGDGEKYLLSKTAASTGTENEYEITLTVNPSITWPKKQVIVEKSFEEILYSSAIMIRNNNNDKNYNVYGPVELNGTSYDDYQEVFKKNSKLGGANGGMLMPSQELAHKYTTNDSNPKRYGVKKIVIGNTVVNLRDEWWVMLTSFSNNSTVWLFPNGMYIKVDVTYSGTQVGNGNSAYWTNGTLTLGQATNIEKWVLEAVAEYVAEDDIGNWTNATIAKPNFVTDPMGDYISFLNFTNIDDDTASGNPAASSYSSALYAGSGKTITWTFNNTLSKGSSDSDYRIIDGKYYLTSSQYILKYKIRLDVHESGFKSTNPFTMVGSENWYNTNNTTTLRDDDGDQNFDIPQVVGILYDLKFTKVDEAGEPVEGAVFALTGSGNNGAVTYGSSTGNGITTYDKTAESDENGVVTFSGLPWGDYEVFEISAPDGYAIDTTRKKVTLCYTTEPTGLINSDVEGNSSHLMNKEYTSEAYKYTDPVIRIAIKKVDDQENILTASPQAVFTLTNTDKTNTDNSSKSYSATVSDSGQDRGYAVLTKVPAGTYTLTETTAPTGYKTIAPATVVVGVDGTISVENSSGGLVTETNDLTLNADNGKTYRYSAIQVKNKKSSAKVVIRKTDEKGYYGENGADTAFLSGAAFTLTKGDGTALSGITLQTSDENGYVTTAKGIELDAGTYHLTETTAPEGYNSVSGPITITVNDSEQNRVTAQHDVTSYDVVPDSENNIYTVYIENNPGVELPETGGTGFLSPQTLCGIMAMAFVLATAVMYGFSMRRGERRSI